MSSFLDSYKRQPKIYIDLPMSNYYPNGTLEDEQAVSLPVFGLTAADEILLKTPDALFNGEATKSVIRSCIPAIKDPGQIPTMDIDFCLIAIRIATYGENLDMNVKCNSCDAVSTFSLSLQSYLEHYQDRDFDSSCEIEGLKFNFRPLTYNEMNEFNLKNYNLQRQSVGLPEEWSQEQKDQHLSEVMKQLTDLQLNIMLRYLESIEDPSTTSGENDAAAINKFISEADSMFYRGIKDHVDSIKKEFANPTEKVTCPECETEITTKVNLDYSNFFGLRS